VPAHARARAFLEGVAKHRILITYQELANSQEAGTVIDQSRCPTDAGEIRAQRLHMPGSLTTPGRPGARADAAETVAAFLLRWLP
jgi:hypothetical protein